MKVKVKTKWGAGLVSVASPYVRIAIKRGEELEIELNGATIKVPYDELLKKKPRDATFNDKSGRRRDYSLYDFSWSDYVNETR